MTTKKDLRGMFRIASGSEAEEVTRAQEGLEHETYFISSEDGKFVLQISGESHTNHNALNHCLRMYRYFKDSSIPVPKALTKEALEYENQEFMVVNRLPGENLKKSIERRNVRKSGKLLAKIHNKTNFNKAGWIGFGEELEVHEFEEGSQRAKILSELDDKCQILAQNGLEIVSKEIDNLLRENLSGIILNRDYVICHDDFTPDNVLFKDGRITGVIDFDYAYAGSPLVDLVKSANGFWIHDPGADWNVREEFYSGYREIRGLDEQFQVSEPILRVQTLAWLVASLIDMDELDQNEIDFYGENLRDEIERAEKVLNGSHKD